MEIPEFVIDRGMFFALRFSNMTDEEEIKELVTEIIERGVRTVNCFGGEVMWKE